jgi:type II secretory pathway component PulF
MFVFPGYYWFWHRRHSFDYKVSVVADLLEDGVSLEEALQAVPGVASQETLLAIGVGASSKRLALSLRGAARKPENSVLMEVLPRLFYPLVLLAFISVFLTFWGIYILPKIKGIFRDFKLPLPDVTQWVADVAEYFMAYGLVLPLLLVLAIVFLLLCCNTAFCWYCPGLSRFYRMYMRSRLLKMLSVLLDAGLTAPMAVEELAQAGFFRGLLQRRLKMAMHDLEQGEPLAETLYRRGFLSRAMVALVKAAEGIRNLPWVLSELGDNLARRVVGRLLRFSQLFAPISVVAVGVLVGFIVLGIFMPLIQIMMEMNE